MKVSLSLDACSRKLGRRSGGACHAGTLWLGNAAYLYLSVSFIQMLKALMPVAVFCTGCTFGIESFSVGALANMVRKCHLAFSSILDLAA